MVDNEGVVGKADGMTIEGIGVGVALGVSEGSSVGIEEGVGVGRATEGVADRNADVL